MSATGSLGGTQARRARDAIATAESSLAAREIVPVLNYLISICKDGFYGFRTAAFDVPGPACRDLFAGYAAQRAELAGELAGLVLELGFEPSTEGSLAGLLHREWIDVKAALTGGRTVDVVLDECARGEATALKAYEEALRHPLGTRVAPVVRRQYEVIQASHANIQSLRTLQSSD